MNEELLRPYIRAVTAEDRKILPRFSYSKIEQFLNCPMAYDFKYNQKMYGSDTSIALELGSLLHAVLERKGHMLQDGNIDYELLDKLINDGIIETSEKTRDQIPGVNTLRSKYWEIWFNPDTEGRTYEEKLMLFKEVLHSEMQDDENWKPYAFEMPFEFVWDNKVILNGFIDRVDISTDGEFRVIDYKTSKKVFSKEKLPTSLQFGIYNLALLANEQINQLAVDNIYRFILLNDYQKALTKGWEKRLAKKLTQVFTSIADKEVSNRWDPKPTPLCHWCFASETNPDAKEYKGVCEYYSLWTPENKTFEKKKEWNALENKEETKRKLIF